MWVQEGARLSSWSTAGSDALIGTHWLNMVSYSDIRPSCPAAAHALQQRQRERKTKASETKTNNPKPGVTQARRAVLRHELGTEGVRAPALGRQHV